MYQLEAFIGGKWIYIGRFDTHAEAKRFGRLFTQTRIVTNERSSEANGRSGD